MKNSYRPLKATMFVIGVIIIVVSSLCASLLAYTYQVLNGTKIEVQIIQQIS